MNRIRYQRKASCRDAQPELAKDKPKIYERHTERQALGSASDVLHDAIQPNVSPTSA